MRRLLILALLFGLMLALPILQVGGMDEAFSPLSLATFGFILLAAYTLGEIAGRLGLPRITGYIATGLVFGPSVINLFSEHVVSDLRVINELAIGLIALSAGGEMKLGALRKIAKSLSLIVLIKGGLTIAAVTGAVVLLKPFLPFLADAPVALAASVGLIFGVLAIGTSPAATIAVINETGSKGRLADTTLGVAVVKDIVMVIGLAVAIALTKVFATAGSHFDVHVLVLVGEELGLSILAGAILGGVIIAYLRYVGAELWLFVIAIVFAMSAIATSLHLEALLTFIVAGFVVQNASKRGDSFVHLIEGVALPVYVVFFSVAGAGLDLTALAQVGLVALALVVVRLAAIWAGTGLATRLASDPGPIRKFGWMAFVSQAGVVIGLSLLVEANLPSLGPEIRTVIMGTVAINLLLGPVLFKVALSKVGETSAARTPSIDESENEASGQVIDDDAPPDAADEPALPEPKLRSPKLQGPALQLRTELVDLLDAFGGEALSPTIDEHRRAIEQFRAESIQMLHHASRDVPRAIRTYPDESERRDAALRVLRRHREGLAGWLQAHAEDFSASPSSDAFVSFLDAAHERAKSLTEPVFIRVEPDRLEAREGDSTGIRVRKLLRRTGYRFRRVFSGGITLTRRIRPRRIARYHLGGRLPERVQSAAGQAAALPVFAIERARGLFSSLDVGLLALAREDAPPTENWPDAFRHLESTISADFDQADADLLRYSKEIERRLTHAVGVTYADVLQDLDAAAEGNLPKRARRFSKVHEQAHISIREYGAHAASWANAATGVQGWLVNFLELVRLRDSVRQIVDETALKMATHLREEVTTRMKGAADALEVTKLAITESDDLIRALGVARERLPSQLDSEALEPLRKLQQDQALRSLLDRLLERFNTLTVGLPNDSMIVDPASLPAPESGRVPTDARLHSAPLRLAARTFLETKLAKNLADVDLALQREVGLSAQSIAEVSQQVRFALDAALEAEETEAPDADGIALDGLRRAALLIDEARSKTADLETQIAGKLASATANLLDELEEAVSARSELEARIQRGRLEALGRGTRLVDTVREGVRIRFRRIRTALQRRLFPLAQDLRRDLRSALPLEALTPAEQFERADQAVLEAALENLPFVYRKLFGLDPLEADEFLMGREDELKAVKSAIRRWADGHPTPLAIVGQPGAGVSSMLHAIRRGLSDTYPVSLLTCTTDLRNEEKLTKAIAQALDVDEVHGFSAETTLMGLRDAVLQHKEPFRVVLLDDVERLSERRPGGFEIMRRLLSFVSETGSRVAWLLGARSYAWAWLDTAVGTREVASLTLHLDPLTAAELEQAIMVRHRVSGLTLNVRPSPRLLAQGRFRRGDPETQQGLARREFFARLHRTSHGNPLEAVFLWLRAASVADDTITIRPLEPLRLAFIPSLDDEAQLVLRMALEGRVVDTSTLSLTLGITRFRAISLLAHLQGLNLLAQTSERYELHRPVAHAIGRELEGLALVSASINIDRPEA